jgi:ApbE superfamily uncharacterized protein (UPF0280 family)
VGRRQSLAAGAARLSPTTAGGPARRPLEDKRWLFQHGPIDLVIGCDGDEAACEAAIERAWQRFAGVLAELVPVLAQLRTPLPESAGWSPDPAVMPIAARMVDACRPFAERHRLFITPMAAVAGAVADEIATCFARTGIRRAYVNNGGDIALHLTPGERYDLGVVTRINAPDIDGRFTIDAAAPVRGVATSGWRGRSFSLGIADSVTVLAASGAAADAAATLVANRVDVPSPVIVRRPANQLRDDTDLGERLVTVAVGTLSRAEVEQALSAGAAFAEQLRQEGLIAAAALSLQGRSRVVRQVSQVRAGS